MFGAMRHFIDYKELTASREQPRVVTIGNFDGVHRGHQAVMAEARKEANQLGTELAVLTFEPHPAELLQKESPRQRLVEPQRKVELLSEHGADLVLAQRFDERFSDLSAEQFAVDVLGKALNAKLVIVGKNFRFGHDRKGDVNTLSEFGNSIGFSVKSEQLLQFDKTEVSSTRIRQMLSNGDVSGARKLLGRYHTLPGTVKTGQGQGKELGFPTVNLGDIAVLAPGPGIYAAHCDIGDSVEKAAAYIGNRPTMGFGNTIEAFLLDYSGDLYGKRIILKFIERVRGDQKFDSVESLVGQIALDVEKARELIRADSGQA